MSQLKFFCEKINAIAEPAATALEQIFRLFITTYTVTHFFNGIELGAVQYREEEQTKETTDNGIGWGLGAMLKRVPVHPSLRKYVPTRQTSRRLECLMRITKYKD